MVTKNSGNNLKESVTIGDIGETYLTEYSPSTCCRHAALPAEPTPRGPGLSAFTDCTEENKPSCGIEISKLPKNLLDHMPPATTAASQSTVPFSVTTAETFPPEVSMPRTAQSWQIFTPMLRAYSAKVGPAIGGSKPPSVSRYIAAFQSVAVGPPSLSFNLAPVIILASISASCLACLIHCSCSAICSSVKRKVVLPIIL